MQEPGEGDGASGGTALVLLGGGAKAAYQVGFLLELARREPGLHFPILSGVSSGAINIAFLAADRSGEGFALRVDALAALWKELRTEQVMKVGVPSLATNVALWSLRLFSGGTRVAEVRGLVDSSPLCALLESHLGPSNAPIRGIAENLEAGQIRAVTMGTTCFSSAESVIWVQGMRLPRRWSREGRMARHTELTVDHVMASSSLPLFFSAVELDGTWHGDGGVHLPSPLSPAIHLGADRILVISNYSRNRSKAQPPSPRGYPPPAEVAGTLMNAVFVDRLADDVRSVTRINALLDQGYRSAEGLRPIALRACRPSRSLDDMALEYEHLLPRAFRFMTRGLGTRQTGAASFLSTILFQPDYLAALMELGREDAVREGDALLDFLRPERTP